MRRTHALVHELVVEQARRAPDAIAIVDGDRQLTYGELEAQSHRMAARLLDVGLGRGDRVAVCADRSSAWVATWLGILRSGAAYVALDPSHPIERLRDIAADSGADVVLAQEPFAQEFASGPVPVEVIEDLLDDVPGDWADATPLPVFFPEELAVDDAIAPVWQALAAGACIDLSLARGASTPSGP